MCVSEWCVRDEMQQLNEQLEEEMREKDRELEDIQGYVQNHPV